VFTNLRFEPGFFDLPVRFAASAVTRCRAGISRPPIGAVWGWAQVVAGRTATGSLVPGAALVLSPHQDDETIGCGLLLAEKANREIPIAVAVATDGRGGWYSAMPRPDPNHIAEIRRREWHRALDALGVAPADRFELEFPDGELIHHEDELTEKLCNLFRRVRPSQVFVTRSGDPHPDHQTLARAARRAAHQIYDPGSGVPDTDLAEGSSLGTPKSRPRFFTYRVYPGEGLWPEGRPPRVTIGAVVALLGRSILRLTTQRPLLFRAPAIAAKKVAAIDAYDSQSRLLKGELRYVWGKDVELYWPMEVDGWADA
jgi:LmbE family N-acetylglucosaminyl deacetylase